MNNSHANVAPGAVNAITMSSRERSKLVRVAVVLVAKIDLRRGSETKH
jgi:hypothetical protein